MRKRVPALLLALLMLCGCGAKEDAHPQWAAEWTRAGDILAVETPEGFALAESNDVLSLSGLWYFTWASGEGYTVTNGDAQEATAYDAQIYLLLCECADEAKARVSVEDWMVREAETYTADGPVTVTAGDQTYEMLTLHRSGGSPYDHGAAAFAARGALAISVEVLCAPTFTGDAQTILTAFLTGFHFGTQEV